MMGSQNDRPVKLLSGYDTGNELKCKITGCLSSADFLDLGRNIVSWVRSGTSTVLFDLGEFGEPTAFQFLILDSIIEGVRREGGQVHFKNTSSLLLETFAHNGLNGTSRVRNESLPVSDALPG